MKFQILARCFRVVFVLWLSSGGTVGASIFSNKVDLMQHLLH